MKRILSICFLVLMCLVIILFGWRTCTDALSSFKQKQTLQKEIKTAQDQISENEVKLSNMLTEQSATIMDNSSLYDSLVDFITEECSITKIVGERIASSGELTPVATFIGIDDIHAMPTIDALQVVFNATDEENFLQILDETNYKRISTEFFPGENCIIVTFLVTGGDES